VSKTMRLIEGVHRHPEMTVRPVSIKDWQQHFQPDPATSLEALLIKLGPFKPDRDAFLFDNGFRITDEQVEQIRQRYRLVIDFVLGASPLQFARDVLDSLGVDIPIIGHVGLPDIVKDAVLGDIRSELISLLAGGIFDLTSTPFGRCGGMAFAGYDFYLLGWNAQDPSFGTTPPQTGVLGDYIFSRLLDSLDSNAGTFLEWFTNLHLMPQVSTVANAALVTAVGSLLSGPIGAAFAALLGSGVHVFDLGGPKSLLNSSKDEWSRIKSTLDLQTACPVGCLFEDSASVFSDHQILAIGYHDSTSMLTVWDNNQGPHERELFFDFTGGELQVSNFLNDRPLKGIFLEAYSPHQPPASLHLP
jgi:hypothetical protein